MTLSHDYLESFRIVLESYLQQSGERLAPLGKLVEVSCARGTGGSGCVLVFVSGIKTEVIKLLRKKRINYIQEQITEKACFFIGLEGSDGLENLGILHHLLTSWAEEDPDRPALYQDAEVLAHIEPLPKHRKLTKPQH